MSKYLSTIDIEYPISHIPSACAREAASLYLYLLTRKFKVPAGGTAKVILKKGSVPEAQTLLDICTYSHPLQHLDGLPSDASEHQARKALIDEITDALLALAKLKGWDPEPIQKLRAEVAKRDFRFAGTSGKSLKNPSKILTACAAWSTDKYINIGVNLQADKKTPQRFIATTRIGISLGLFESLLGPVEWMSDTNVRLFHTNKRDYWEIDTNTNDVAFHFPRAVSGDAHGQYDLAKMYIDGWIVEQDLNQAEKWLKKSADQNFSRAVKLLTRLEAGEENFADPLMNSMK